MPNEFGIKIKLRASEQFFRNFRMAAGKSAPEKRLQKRRARQNAGKNPGFVRGH